MIREIPLSEIRVKPLFESQIPPLQPDELKMLEENILEEGCIINPLILWKGIVVDGHNRFHILQKHPEIRFTVFDKEFDDENDAVAWICKNQLGRRNLTPEQKKYLIGKQYSAEKKSFGGVRNKKPALDQDDSEQDDSTSKISSSQNENLKNNERTSERIARENHVSHAYVTRAEEYALGIDSAEEAAPGTRRKILSGELKPTAKEISDVAKASDHEEKKKLTLSLGEQSAKKAPKVKENRGQMSQILHIAENMESPAGSEKDRPERQLDDRTAFDELTDAWETFRARWDACFEIHPIYGKTMRKKLSHLTAAAISYLKTKEEEANEDNGTSLSGNDDQQQIS